MKQVLQGKTKLTELINDFEYKDYCFHEQEKVENVFDELIYKIEQLNDSDIAAKNDQSVSAESSLAESTQA